MKDTTKKILQDHVQMHEYDVDPLDIWSGIEKKQKKKNRKGFIWFLGLVAFIISGISLLYFNFSTSKHAAPLASEIENNITDEIPTYADESFVKSNENIETTRIKKTSENVELSTKNRSNSTKPATNSKDNKNTKVNINKTSNRLTRNGNTAQNSQENTSSNNTTITDNLVSTNDGSNKGVTPLKNRANVSKVTTLPINASSDNSSNILAGNAATQPDQSELHASVVDIRESLTELAQIQQLINFQTVEQATIIVPTTKIDDNFSRNPWVYTDAKEKYEVLWSVTVLGNISFFDKETTAIDQANALYAQERSAKVQPLERYGSSLLLNAQLTKWLTISTGLDYQKINEQFEWNGSYLIDNQDRIIGHAEDIEMFANEDNIRIVDRELSIYNNQQLLNLPIQLSIHQSIKTVSFGVFGRTKINLLNSVEGFSLDERLLPTSLENFQQKIKPQWTLGAFFEVPLYRAWKLHAAVGFNQAEINENVLNNKYNFKEFALGLKHQF